MNHHLLPISEIQQLLNTNPDGLHQSTVEERQNEYGKNELTEELPLKSLREL